MDAYEYEAVTDISYESDFVEDSGDDYEALINAQQQWDESLQQLSKVLNWIILPLAGKFVGRRVAIMIWKRVANHLF